MAVAALTARRCEVGRRVHLVVNRPASSLEPDSRAGGRVVA